MAKFKKSLTLIVILGTLFNSGCQYTFEKVDEEALKNAKWGYIDINGNYVIEPQFDYATEFNDEGVAQVEINGEIKLIDSKGNIIGEAEEYTSQTKEKDELEEIIPIENFYVDDLIPVEVEGKWGYKDKSGNMVIEPQFDYAEKFLDSGIAQVRDPYGYGFIDKNGEIVLEAKYRQVFGFDEYGMAKINIGGSRYGYIDKNANIIIEPKYGFIYEFNENGIAVVSDGNAKGENYGFIRRDGEEILKPQYWQAENFTDNGLAAVALGRKWGYINEYGEMVIERKFYDAKSFSPNGLAAVRGDVIKKDSVESNNNK